MTKVLTVLQKFYVSNKVYGESEMGAFDSQPKLPQLHVCCLSKMVIFPIVDLQIDSFHPIFNFVTKVEELYSSRFFQ